MVQPLNVAKPETMIHHGNIDDCRSFLSKPSSSRLQPILEPILEHVLTLALVDNDADNTAKELSKFDDKGIPAIIVTRNQAIHVPSTSQQITLSPPPILTSQSVMREVCNNIFNDLMELVNSRNQAINIKNYEDKWNNLKEVVNRVLDELQI